MRMLRFALVVGLGLGCTACAATTPGQDVPGPGINVHDPNAPSTAGYSPLLNIPPYGSSP